MTRTITTRNVSVNVAKIVTLLCLVSLLFLYDVHARQAVYLLSVKESGERRLQDLAL